MDLDYLHQTNKTALGILNESERAKTRLYEAVDIDQVITDLINTSWGGSNDEQAKAVELLKGLAFSEDPKSNRFMDALDQFTSGLDPEDFTKPVEEK